jgi:hypothetical protein
MTAAMAPRVSPARDRSVVVPVWRGGRDQDQARVLVRARRFGGEGAKHHKQFLTTLSVIFPLTMLVPWLLTPLFRAAPVLRMPGGPPLPSCRDSRRADDLRNHASLRTAYGGLAVPVEGRRVIRGRSLSSDPLTQVDEDEPIGESSQTACPEICHNHTLS